MFQPKPGTNHVPPNITIDNVPLNVVDKFTYLGSTFSVNAMIDDDISARLGEASASFGRLTKRLWNERGGRMVNLRRDLRPPMTVPSVDAHRLAVTSETQLTRDEIRRSTAHSIYIAVWCTPVFQPVNNQRACAILYRKYQKHTLLRM